MVSAASTSPLSLGCESSVSGAAVALRSPTMLRSYSVPMILSLAIALLSCSGSQTGKAQGGEAPEATTELLSAPFDADSAYSYVAQQVAFGPRTPGSEGHKLCGDWIVSLLKGWGYEVQEQTFPSQDYHGRRVKGRNIIASRSGASPDRVLLMAHWDTRPVADHDPIASRQSSPILGADDGGSGVAVLLELARQYALGGSPVGVDFLFFDLEDGGSMGDDETWCLGSQYWAQHPHAPQDRTKYGILVDMVGARGARFYYEGYSKAYAAPLLRELWSTAARLGWGAYFKPSEGGALIDDHVPVIKHLRIPCVDIVHYNPSNDKGFGDHWHTHADDLEIIDRETLLAVGQTVATTIAQRH